MYANGLFNFAFGPEIAKIGLKDFVYIKKLLSYTLLFKTSRKERKNILLKTMYYNRQYYFNIFTNTIYVCVSYQNKNNLNCLTYLGDQRCICLRVPL